MVSLARPEACDACGYWYEDPELQRNTRRDGTSWPLYVSSSHIADAMFEIIVPPSENLPDGGMLYLCSHHHNQHMPAIAAQGLTSREWQGHKNRT